MTKEEALQFLENHNEFLVYADNVKGSNWVLRLVWDDHYNAFCVDSLLRQKDMEWHQNMKSPFINGIPRWRTKNTVAALLSNPDLRVAPEFQKPPGYTLITNMEEFVAEHFVELL